MSAFDGLEPAVVWKNFEAITKVPRPSGHEEKLAAYLASWAEERGFTWARDDVGNLVIRVPATPGKENVPTVVLQGHLDMVCEKNNDVEFDFMNEGIRVVRDGDWLKADGTTLGADNGIGLAMSMAVAEDPDAAHGPLELLATVEEETGLTGATSLQPGFVQGRKLINIDSEEEGYIFAGCAGGADSECVFPVRLEAIAAGSQAVSITVKGLAGGHSGLAIHENRANAVKLTAALLKAVADNLEVRVADFDGGDKHNAIPREATAVVVGAAGLKETALAKAEELKPLFVQEYGQTDPNLTIEISDATAQQAISAADTGRLVDLILALPHGVDAMSKDIPGLVESSTNVASIKWTDSEAKLLNSSRSSVDPAIDRIRQQIAAATRLAGAEPVMHEGYPGWQPNMASELLAFARNVYEQTTGKSADITAIHAGLECGIIGEKYPGMDMISAGPDMFDVHSPDERLSISSTARFYPFLKALLDAVE